VSDVLSAQPARRHGQDRRHSASGGAFDQKRVIVTLLIVEGRGKSEESGQGDEVSQKSAVHGQAGVGLVGFGGPLLGQIFGSSSPYC
jgi:hypothetical protein